MKFPYLSIFILFTCLFSVTKPVDALAQSTFPADYQLDRYLPQLKNKKVAVVANQTAVIKGKHLVDILLDNEVQVKYVFAPEHGFRGSEDAGAVIRSDSDKKTGLPIISLYGANKKPNAKYIKGLDYVIFDLQDVGTRFYTYISTMHYVMETCAEQNVPLMILDRPNPNGRFVDGPVREEDQKSFVGMHPIPVLHGMTIAEIALMINGEGWLTKGLNAPLEIIKMESYDREDFYSLPIKPSPNLPNDLSIRLYPTLCFFEGTVISVGRGTDKPFQQIGHPALKEYSHLFTPKAQQGASNPPYKGEKCYGIEFDSETKIAGLEMELLIKVYNDFTDKSEFFNAFFSKLAGTKSLQRQIEAGFSAEEIRLSWKDDLSNFQQTRAKYLLYP